MNKLFSLFKHNLQILLLFGVGFFLFLQHEVFDHWFRKHRTVQYELTRHNIGFLTLDRLADQKNVKFEMDRLAYHTEFKFKGRTIHLIKPTTYMNLSGKAMKFWMQELKIRKENTSRYR